jgi:hypothetical protein
VVGHVGQAGEDFTKISVRVKAASAAAFDEGINNGAAFTGPGVTHKEPVFLADVKGSVLCIYRIGVAH